MPKRFPHIYQFHSRLGLRNLPHGGVVPNVGVENGPTALVSALRASTYAVDRFDFPLPESVNQNTYLLKLATCSQQATQLISSTLLPNQTMVALGGDHSISYASLAAMLERYSVENCGLIIFDSHADLHQPSTSPSGNFHGMWLRPFVDTFEEESIDTAIPTKLSASQLFFIGNLLTEPAEESFLQMHHVTSHSRIDQNTREELHRFLSTYHHIHISFDIDVFRTEYVPGVGTPNPAGLTPPQVWPLLRQIKTHPSISLDMVEVNPVRDTTGRTVNLAARVVKELLR